MKSHSGAKMDHLVFDIWEPTHGQFFENGKHSLGAHPDPHESRYRKRGANFSNHPSRLPVLVQNHTTIAIESVVPCTIRNFSLYI